MHRAVLKDWFARNENRIHIKTTSEGEEYVKAMKTWQLAGAQPELKPSWKGRGERSVDKDGAGEAHITQRC